MRSIETHERKHYESAKGTLCAFKRTGFREETACRGICQEERAYPQYVGGSEPHRRHQFQGGTGVHSRDGLDWAADASGKNGHGFPVGVTG